MFLTQSLVFPLLLLLFLSGCVCELPPVSERDSGIYYCSVWQQVPVLSDRISGGGTEIIVESTGRNTTDPGPGPGPGVMSLIWKLLLLASVLVVCVVSVTCCFKHRGCCMRRKRESQLERAADTNLVYSVVKFHKLHEKKNTQEVSEAPDAGSASNEEVLYSDIHFRS
ncbi:hypothetical protein KOW79_003787 [Hemibagrus wyckioides]|uniref:Uncharacterized protein n=1 Tax=Hemibagrus wyckioides TaxID=337641 RepID=A0A9D3SUN9_9TELE|nr:hypothetical protein KOW79_003787 [Hemibagrus wyckioides]